MAVKDAGKGLEGQKAIQASASVRIVDLPSREHIPVILENPGVVDMKSEGGEHRQETADEVRQALKRVGPKPFYDFYAPPDYIGLGISKEDVENDFRKVQESESHKPSFIKRLLNLVIGE